MITRRILLLGLGGAALGGCARREAGAQQPREGRKLVSRVFGFGRRDEDPYDTPQGDPRALVDQVVSLRLERNRGGAILHAIGLPPQQGFFDGDLVPLDDGKPVKGMVSFEFRIAAPAAPTRVSTQASREVLVGLFLTNQQLADVRRIRVIAAQNSRTVSRR